MERSDFLTPSGREVVDPRPFELGVRLGQKPKETLEQRLLRMLQAQRMDEDEVIRDVADALEDAQDFEEEDDPYFFPETTRYTVPDDVPDGFSASEYRKAQAEKKKNSPNGSGDAQAASAGVAGE